jgi:hypothetical protein
MGKRKNGSGIGYDLKEVIPFEQIEKRIYEFNHWTDQCKECIHQVLYGELPKSKQHAKRKEKIDPGENTCPCAAIFDDADYFVNRVETALKKANPNVPGDEIAHLREMIRFICGQFTFRLRGSSDGEENLCQMWFPRFPITSEHIVMMEMEEAMKEAAAKFGYKVQAQLVGDSRAA